MILYDRPIVHFFGTISVEQGFDFVCVDRHTVFTTQSLSGSLMMNHGVKKRLKCNRNTGMDVQTSAMRNRR